MNRALAIVVVAALSGSGVLAQAPQIASAQTGTIQGVVVAADTNAPLRIAHVVLIGTATGTLKVTSTGGDGRFTFANLPVDRYTIGASKPPYLGAVAGAKRPARTGTPIVVAAGQTIGDVVVRLPPGAAISGMISQANGLPAAGVTVSLRRWQMRGPERVLVPAQTTNALTDERGRYRIAGLSPGDYVVSATPTGIMLADRMPTTAEVDAALKGTPSALALTQRISQAQRDAQAYYPGTVREEDAGVISLTAGEDRQEIDFRIDRVRTSRLEGIVTAEDGTPLPNVVIGLRVPSRQFTTGGGGTRSGPDGRFTLPYISPGTFVLTAAQVNVRDGLAATIVVEVGGADISGLQLVLRPPASVTAGRLQFDGASSQPSVVGRVVPFRTMSPALTGMAWTAGATDATGAFKLTGMLPGRYAVGAGMTFGASADSVKWSLKSVVVDGRDMTDLPLDVSVDAPPKEIVVTYTDRWQEITGRLQLAGGAPATDYTVVVFPADRAYWVYESRRIAIARPGTNGQFAFGGPGPSTLPPGDYLIAAVTDIDRSEQYDPSFLATLASAGAVRVTLAPGDRKTQDLAIR